MTHGRLRADRSRAAREARSVTTSRRRAIGEHPAPRPAGLARLQQQVGNRATCDLLDVAQAKLEVGASDDHQEKEADMVARQVVAALRQAGSPDRPLSDTQRTDRFEERALRMISRRAEVGAAGGTVTAATEAAIGAARSGGAALDEGTRTRMEGAFGADFGQVRVHTGPVARQLSEQVQAKAFTLGNSIFFRDAMPDPATSGGQELLAHELTHTIQQGAAPMLAPGAEVPSTARRVVQRKRTALTTKEVLATLKALPFMKGKLGQTLHTRTMDERVTSEMRSYKEHFAKKTGEDMDLRDAMMLSMALSGVARIISEELNDVSVQPTVMAKLFELYQGDVERQLRRKKSSLKRSQTSVPKILGLTGALMDGDPVTQYMHREIHLDVAAAQITAMTTKAQAFDATLTPAKMYELLEQRFQAKMASYSKAELHADDPTATYNTAESHGEYSRYFYEKLFGNEAFTGPGESAGWDRGGAGAGDRLAFAADSEQRLTVLRQRVANPPPAVALPVPRSTRMTPRQEKHLASIEGAEAAAADPAGMKRAVAAEFAERYSLTPTDAARLYDDVAVYLRTSVPLTITAKAADWFAAGKHTSRHYKPAAARKATTPMSAVFGKAQALGDIEHLPTWVDGNPLAADARGSKYLRFRHWKDQLLTGLGGLEAGEMPVFGAANSTWEGSRGSDSPDTHGANFYGDFHFVLKRNKVKDRMVYTATDHGQARRDPMLALQDFMSDERGLTWLKGTKKALIVDSVVNAVRLKLPYYMPALMFEMQIFGGVNIRTDVAEVHISKLVDGPTEQRIRTYYQGTGVQVIKIADNAPAAYVRMTGDLTDIDRLALVLAGHGDLGGQQGYKTDTEQAKASVAGTQNFLQALPYKIAYATSLYIKRVCTQGAAGITAADIVVLDAAADRMNRGVLSATALPDLLKQNLAARVKEASDALAAVKALQPQAAQQVPVLVGADNG